MELGDQRSLAPLFAPRSIAVIGASSNPDRVAGMPVRFLREFGYAGRILPVNPKQQEIQGLRCYASIAAINEPIDLAILSVSAEASRTALEEAGRAGVRAAVMFASGFAEVGAEGLHEQQLLLSIARRSGMRLLGPNCLGFMNVGSAAYATFSPALESGVPRAGNVAIVSQSGAFGIFALVRARDRGIGISVFASTGNEADVDFADCLAYLAREPNTRVIAAYLEGVRDGSRLADALELARRNRKAVVVCKAGSSPLGTRAAASHTAALAGRDEVFDGVFRQYGAYRARDVDELFDIAYACSISPLPRSRKLGIISMSGGAGVSLADAAQEFHLEVPELDEHIKRKILERVPHAGVTGPLDLTGRTLDDRTLFSDAVDWAVGAGAYDSVVAFQAVTGITPRHRPLITATWSVVRERYPELPIAVVTAFDAETRSFVEGIGCLAFDEPRRAVRALAALASIREGFDRESRRDVPPPAMPSAAGRGASEADALAFLGEAGIPIVPYRLAHNAAEAVAAADALGFPVAVKVLSPDIAHKSDVGGVALGLRSAGEVADAFGAVVTRAKQARPEARILGALVAPMVNDGVECILGALVDPIFGPVVMCGMGGVMVEVLRDTAFRMAPIDVAEAHRMIRELRAHAVFAGVRARPAADVDALAQALSRLSHLIAANAAQIESIEVNPFLVSAHGRGGGLALDGLVVPRPLSSATEGAGPRQS